MITSNLPEAMLSGLEDAIENYVMLRFELAIEKDNPIESKVLDFYEGTKTFANRMGETEDVVEFQIPKQVSFTYEIPIHPFELQGIVRPFFWRHFKDAPPEDYNPWVALEKALQTRMPKKISSKQIEGLDGSDVFKETLADATKFTLVEDKVLDWEITPPDFRIASYYNKIHFDPKIQKSQTLGVIRATLELSVAYEMES